MRGRRASRRARGTSSVRRVGSVRTGAGKSRPTGCRRCRPRWRRERDEWGGRRDQRWRGTYTVHPDVGREQAYFDRAKALRDRQGETGDDGFGSGAGRVRPARAAAGPLPPRRPRRRRGLRAHRRRGRQLLHRPRRRVGRRVRDGRRQLAGADRGAVLHGDARGPGGLPPGGCTSARATASSRSTSWCSPGGRPPRPRGGRRRCPTPCSTRSRPTARASCADIVATIQQAQYEVITQPLDQLLIVQGGPGTGKTQVGLHRVSWMLHNHADHLGPRRRAGRRAQPGLHPLHRRRPAGAGRAGHRAAADLRPRAAGPHRAHRPARAAPPEGRPPDAAGDRQRAAVPPAGRRRARRGGIGRRTVRLDGNRVAARARQLATRTHNEGHRELRSFLLEEVRNRLSSRGGPTSASTRSPAARPPSRSTTTWPTPGRC